MKKRLLSWLMVLTLCLTLLPTAALAAENEGGAGSESGSAPLAVENGGGTGSTGSESEGGSTPAVEHTHYLCAGKDESSNSCTCPVKETGSGL